MRENNQTAGKTWTYAYDDGGNIQSKTEYAYTTGTLGAAVRTVNYGYDSDGKRITKTVDGTTYNYHYLGDQLVELTWGGNKLHFTYDSTGPLSVNYNGTEYFYVKNAQGDVTGLVSTSGARVVTYTYDAWGNPLTTTGSMAATLGEQNPLRYRGYVYDTETGLYYLQSRYYNPGWGRFINADSSISNVGGEVLGNNIYSYCFNNPIKLSDGSGNWPKWATAVLGIAAAVVAVGITVATLGAAAPAAICALTVAGLTLGIGYTVASVVATVAVIATVTTSAVYAADLAYSYVTGESPLKDIVFRGNEDAYNAGLIITSIASTGVFAMAEQGLSSGVCFVAGTTVKLKEGYCPIEEVRAGDLVWSENPENGERKLKKVVRTFKNTTDELIHVFVDCDEIITTPEHPFYVPFKGWVSATELRAGDILVTQSGKYVIIGKVEHETLELPVVVYNFEVEDFHTYYVGGSSVLVHNACERMGRQNGNAPRNNQAQNRQFNSVVKEYHLSKSEARRLHDAITVQGYGRDEIIEELIALFPDRG